MGGYQLASYLPMASCDGRVGLFSPRESLASPPPPPTFPDQAPLTTGHQPASQVQRSLTIHFLPPLPRVGSRRGARGRRRQGGDEQSSGPARRERPCCLNTVSLLHSHNRPPGPLALELLPTWPLSSAASLPRISSTRASVRRAFA